MRDPRVQLPVVPGVVVPGVVEGHTLDLVTQLPPTGYPRDLAEQAPDGPDIAFRRLTEVPAPEVQALLNEPRNHRHMPLAGQFSMEAAARWASAKDAQWDEHGYGPEAVYVDGAFAGWGGFQHEPHGTDLSLVLAPRYWGLGAELARRLLARGFDELGLEEVVIALPFTRNPGRVLERLGFRPDGTVTYGAVQFRQFRLSRAAWSRRALA